MSVLDASDLLKRNFVPEAPDRLWVADITYARSWKGWLYLAFVLDAYSRKVVGRSMANHLRTELVLDALNMAIHNLAARLRGSCTTRRCCRGLMENRPPKRGNTIHGSMMPLDAHLPNFRA